MGGQWGLGEAVHTWVLWGVQLCAGQSLPRELRRWTDSVGFRSFGEMPKTLMLAALSPAVRMFIDVIVMITWEWSTKLTAGDDAMGMIMMKTNPRVSLVFNTRQCCGVTLRRGLLLLLLLFVFVFIINFLPCLFVEQCWSLAPCCSEAACVFCIMYFVCNVHHPLL